MRPSNRFGLQGLDIISCYFFEEETHQSIKSDFAAIVDLIHFFKKFVHFFFGFILYRDLGEIVVFLGYICFCSFHYLVSLTYRL